MGEYWEGRVKRIGDEDLGDCPSRGPLGFYGCTRPAGHAGRHMAEGITGDVLAAWPGTHTPTEADLVDQALQPTPDGVVIPTRSLPTHDSDAAAKQAARDVERFALGEPASVGGELLVEALARLEAMTRERNRMAGLVIELAECFDSFIDPDGGSTGWINRTQYRRLREAADKLKQGDVTP
jgi:hypothetical protein